MAQEHWMAVARLPVSFDTNLLDNLSGMIFFRRWKKNDIPTNMVTLCFDSEQSLAYAVRDGIFAQRRHKIEPELPKEIRKGKSPERKKLWLSKEVTRLLNTVSIYESTMSVEESKFRTAKSMRKASIHKIAKTSNLKRGTIPQSQDDAKTASDITPKQSYASALSKRQPRNSSKAEGNSTIPSIARTVNELSQKIDLLTRNQTLQARRLEECESKQSNTESKLDQIIALLRAQTNASPGSEVNSAEVRNN